jgi:hypothetical protein
MALSENINNLEKDKFALNSDLLTAVRTLSEISGGNVSFSGLRIRFKITNLTITDVATAIPATALANRNSIIVQNRSQIDSFFLGESDVSNSGAFEGWEVDATSFFATDVTENIVLYAIAPVGKTIDIKIMELA